MVSQELFIRRLKILLGLTFFAGNLLHAQSSHTLRSFQSVPQALSFELGKLPNYRVFVGAPYISNINGTLKSYGMKFQDMGIGSGKTFFEQDFSSIVNGIEDQTQLDLGLNMDLLYFGYRFGPVMFHMHIGERINFQSDMSKNMFRMLSDIDRSSGDIADNSYDLQSLGIDGMHYRFLGAGLTGAINEYVSIGFRVKYLKGLKVMQTNNNNLSLTGQPNSDYFRIGGNMNIISSGMDYLADLDERNLFDYFRGSSFGSHGVALDFGANFKFTDRLEVYGTIMDLGKVSWTQNIDKYTIDRNHVSIRSSNSAEFEEDLDVVFDDLYSGGSDFDTTFSTKLVSHAYAGARYQLTKLMAISVMANARLLPDGLKVYNSVGFSAILNNYLEVVGNANFGEGRFGIGGGFAASAGPVQFYLAADNLPSAVAIGESKFLQVTGGLNVILGKERIKKKKKKKKFVPRPIEPGVAENDDDDDDESGKAQLTSIEEESQPNPEPAIDTYTEPDVAAPIVGTEETKEEKIDSGPKALPADETITTAEAEEEVEEKPELDRLLVLHGKTVDKGTNEHLTGVSVEFYKIKPDGSPQVMLLQAFYNGNILLHPDRNFPHVIYIRKQGYKTLEYKLSKAEMDGQSELTLRFPMSKN